MVELETEHETTDLSKAINVLNKCVKTLILAINILMDKLDRPFVEKHHEEKMEKMDNIFEKCGVGRPKGDHKAKRLHYFETTKHRR